MTARRKTYPVEDLRRKANYALENLPDGQRERRIGVYSMLEMVLHATGNYRGFNYLPSEWKEDGSGLKDNHDDTRRYYYG